MAYFAMFASDVEDVAPKREFVNVSAKFKREKKERRKRHRI